MKQKQTHRHKEQICGCHGSGSWRRDGEGVQAKQVKTIVYRMNQAQGPAVSHRELYSISYDKP